MAKKTLDFLACDLGASGGRAMLGRFDGARLALSEVHRFPNGPVALPDGIHWDVLRIWSDITHGIGAAVRDRGVDLAGIGIDTWGVDFGLLDQAGNLIGNPYHYRDSRTDGMMDAVFDVVPRDEVFRKTGIQFMQLNSLYQLYAMVLADSPELANAQTLLTMPDLLNYWLTGEKVSEFSIATTTQCYDPRAEAWATEMLKTLGIPAHIFPAIVPTGTVLGPVLDYVAEELGVEGTPIIAPACHDTGSAVAAVPAENEDFVYISCGTWSLMGTELREPLINDDSLAFSVTNEGGVGGTFRFLKNITGLWLVQESRRTWQQQEGQELSWDDLTQMAAEAEPLRSVIDPDDVAFLHPGDMPAHIRDYCRRTGQPVPETKGAVIRCALESLALKYRYVLSNLEQILGRTLTPIHMVGGGIQNRLLCQFTADATGRCVVTGPVEATATGNLLTQAMALGHIGSISEIRQVVRDSFEIASLEPTGDGSNWNEAYGKLLELIEG